MEVLFPSLQKEFKNFYTNLENKKDIFYMFFTTDMLFWAFKSMSFIPPSVNLVFITDGLDEKEKTCLEETFKIPIFYTGSYYDDKDIWEVLFSVNQYNFGWIDCDCLIFNPLIFNDITSSLGKYSMNCIWATPDSLNFYYINTYFVFINVSVINKLKELGLPISPRVYVYDNPQLIKFTKSLIIKDEYYPYIKKIIELEKYPNPAAYQSQDGKEKYFDTLRLFQIIAQAIGFPIQRIRLFENNRNYFSDEAIHIGGSANFSTPYIQTRLNYISDYKFNFNIYKYISYFILKQTKHMLPKKYDMLYRRLSFNFSKENIDEKTMENTLVEFISDKKLNIKTMEKILTYC